MSDVLSAEAVLRLDIDFDPDGDWAKAEASWAALARSHEQLRARVEIELELRKASYDRIAELEAERDAAIEAFDATQERALIAEDALTGAHDTIKRVWAALGDPTYEELAGRSISEVAQAAARAGGCAADALRKIEDLLDSPRGAEPFVRGQCISLAREALDAYDQTGQTGAMTVLDFDKGEARVEPFSTASTVATFTGSGAGPSSAGGCAVDQLNALYDEVCSALDVLVGDTIAKTQADRISRALQILNDALAAVSGQTAERKAPVSVESLLDEDDLAVMAMDNDPSGQTAEKEEA